MKKYFYIFKLNIMSSLQYSANVIMGFFSYFIIIFILMNMWQYMYSDTSQLIHGYSVNQMVWYVIFTEILYFSIGGRELCNQISNDIRSGNIVYNLNKPYNYVGYILSSHFGEVAVKGLLYSFAGISIGTILLGYIPGFQIISIPLILLVSFFAIVINSSFLICIGLVSFWIEDSGPFYWVYSKFILVLGVIFPIEYFPKALQPFLTYSPIYVITYGPAKLFVDFSFWVFVKVLFAQVIYVFIACSLCFYIYKKGVKKLNVNGG